MKRLAYLSVLVLALCLASVPLLRAADAAPKAADVNGIVRDKDGNPAAGADVVLYYAQSEAGPEHGVVARAKTGDDGRFSMPGAFAPKSNAIIGSLAPRYTIIARKAQAGVGYKVLPVDTAPGDTAIALTGPATQKATLTYADGKPAAGEKVFLFVSQPGQVSSNSDILFCMEDIGLLTATTDATGNADVPVPPGSRHYVMASKAGFTKVTGEKKLVLYPSATVTGVVTDADGKPATGVTVRYACQSLVELLSTATITDANGRYTIKDIAADGYRVQMDDQTSMAASGGSVSATAADITGSSAPATFTAKPGQTVTQNLQISRAVELAGTVVDVVTGAPLPGIMLVCYANTSGGYLPRMVTTDAQGKFRSAVPPGVQAFIQFSQSPDSGYLIDQEWQRTSQTGYRPFEGRVDKSRSDLVLKLKLCKLQTIAGKVVDGNGKPVIGAQVFTDPRLTPATTDADGSFTLKAVAPDGKRAMIAKGADLGGMVVPQAGQTSVTITAKPLEDRECLVTTPDGQPAGKLYFSHYPLFAPDTPVGGLLSHAETDAKGNCFLTGLIPGPTYKITWQGENERNRDYGDGNTTFSLASLKADEPIRFTANQYLNALFGKVVNTKGEPIPDARIEIRNWNVARQTNELYNLKSGKDGTFDIQRLASGVIELAISAPNYRQRVFATPTDNVDFVAVLRTSAEPAENEVIACDPQGKPLADLAVTLFTHTQQGQTTQTSLKTDAEGKVPLGKIAANSSAVILCDDPATGFAIISLESYREEGQFRLTARKVENPWRLRLLDESGKPIAGAQVTINSASVTAMGESNYIRQEQMPSFLPADVLQRIGIAQMSDADGRVTFPHFSRRQYVSFSIEARGYGHQFKNPQPSEGDEVADISLYHPATVSGKVSVKGVPDMKFENCQVMLRGPNGGSYANAQPKPDGTFTMQVNEPGEYSAGFYCYGANTSLLKYRLPGSVTVNVESGKSYTINLGLDEGIKVRGKLSGKHDPKGERPKVAVQSDDGMGFSPVMVGEDGSFELTVNGPGTYQVLCSAPGGNSYTPCPESITVPDRKPVEGITITMPAQ